jgi:2-polyprenyl-3-methyl-5-hydroxy-6-metoxy-1,4-benzoquinol methylase
MDHQRTADHWDQQHFDQSFLRAEWSYHPLAKERLHKLLGGVKSREQWFHRKYLKGRSGLKALGIGVGTCESELRLLSMGSIAHYDLYDVSPVALSAGKAEAEKRGVADKASFICKDIHSVDLAPGSYDLITFIASLHHIEDLDGILRQCEKALAPGGLLWAAEYIGPDYFQYPDEDTELARRLYRAIDSDLRRLGSLNCAGARRKNSSQLTPQSRFTRLIFPM